jgi:hypothetical protein
LLRREKCCGSINVIPDPRPGPGALLASCGQMLVLE